MLATIKMMLEAFEKNNIRYCHWKSNEHLNEALNGDTDMDMLFDPEQRTLLEKTLDECGLRRFRSAQLMQYNAIEDFIGFDSKEAKIWHLHTHYRMTLGEKHLKGYTVTPWTNYLLSNRRLDEMGVYCTAIEDELVLLLVRMSLKLRWRDSARNIGDDDLTELKWLEERANRERLSNAAKLMLGEQVAPMLLDLAETNLKHKSQLVKLQKLLRKNLSAFTGYSRLGSWRIRTKRELFWLVGGIKRHMGWSSTEASRRISPAGGCVVAFLGCDGAGKSTTLKYVRKEFNKKIDVAEIYFGSGDGSSSLIRKPMKIIAQKVGGKGVGHAVEREYGDAKKRVSVKAKLYSAAKFIWAVTLAQEKKSKLKKMTKARNNGLLVLTDRYPQSMMPGCNDGPLLSKYQKSHGWKKKVAIWEQKIYESAATNPPDLTIKLVVPTEIAMERKPEMTYDEIERKKQIVMSMDISEKTVIIDTSRPFEETVGVVMQEIWKLV